MLLVIAAQPGLGDCIRTRDIQNPPLRSGPLRGLHHLIDLVMFGKCPPVDKDERRPSLSVRYVAASSIARMQRSSCSRE